ELFSSYLFTRGLPDPDIVIRTSGELRISNFLIWQAAYSEYYPTPAFWPDFGREDLFEAIVAFNQRERRFGLVAEESQ
ncbi:MAG: undecaprenyl diphosphate synthase family protein, partial [Anaerolineae bacterium]